MNKHFLSAVIVVAMSMGVAEFSLAKPDVAKAKGKAVEYSDKRDRAQDRAEKAREEAEERAEKAREEAEERAEKAREEAEERAEKAEERAEKAREEAEESAEKAREKADRDDDGEGKPGWKERGELPPGLAKQRDKKAEQERKELDKGSEQGKAAREENSRKWWKFWE